jgi:class III poly(R)-hydroxyalkanoic acid synthase PhaE subunit
MDWTTQTNEMMKNWTDAQRQLWSGWLEWAQGFSGMTRGTPAFDPMQMFKMGVDTWSGAQAGSAERLAGNIFGTPEIMMRSMNLLMKAWQVAAPQIEKGAPWQPDLRKLLDQWKQEMADLPKRQAATASEFTDLTKTLFERWAPMTAPWLAMVTQAVAGGHPAAAFLSGTQGFNRFLGFEEGALPILTGISELPRGTVVREKAGKFLKAIDSLTDLRVSQAEFHAAIGQAMGKAIERTIDHLAKLAEKGEKITTARDLMRTWFGIADSTLNEVFTTPEFLATQDKMTNALMTHKVRQREALEIVYDALEIPTRGALDEAYRDIQDLKRQVRMLKRALKEVTEAPAKTSAKKAAKQPAASEHAAE